MEKYKKFNVFLLLIVLGIGVFLLSQWIMYTKAKQRCVEDIHRTPFHFEVYFEDDSDTSQFSHMADFFKNDTVLDVSVVSSAQNLKEFRERYKNDRIILQALDTLPPTPENRFPSLLSVTAKKTLTDGEIDSLAGQVYEKAKLIGLTVKNTTIDFGKYRRLALMKTEEKINNDTIVDALAFIMSKNKEEFFASKYSCGISNHILQRP